MNLSTFLIRMRQLAPVALALLGASVAVAAYLQALNYPFVSDDIPYIPENTKLAGLHLTELWRLFIEPYNCCFELLPLRDFSYWLDIKLFGMTPSASRIHNILLYLFCLPLVYVTTLGIWRYFRPADSASAPWAAAAVTALFALHPTLVESVVWISGRKYVLPNLFSMFALWFAVSARREHGLSAPHAAAALVTFVAVMLSKSSYVAVAPVIALLWVLFQRDIPVQNRHRVLLLWPLAILFLAGLLTMVFIASNRGFDSVPFYFGVEAVTRTLAILGWLTRLAVSPESRNFFYPVLEDTHLPVMVTLGGVIMVSAVACGVVLLRKRSLEGFALAAFLLLCMPYMQLVPHKLPSLVSDRYLALAVWPVVLMLVTLAWRFNPALRATLLLVVMLSWGFQTIERSRDWRSNETLIEADFRAYPGHYMPAASKIGAVQLPQGLYRDASDTANSITAPEFRNIAVKLVDAGYAVADAVSTGEPEEAITLLSELEHDLKQPPVQSKWNSPMLFIWLYYKHIHADQWDYLAKQFPDNVLVRYNAGLRMLDMKKHEAAVAHLRAATESQRLPEYVRGAAFRNLGLALLNSGHVIEAEAPLRSALEQWVPDTRAYCLLSKVYRQTNRFEEAAHAEAKCPDRAPLKQ